MNFEQPSPPNNKEIKETPEITDKELVEGLRSRSIDDPELHKLLEKWTEQEEKKVENKPEATIRFNVRRGKLYAEAGYIEEALDTLEGARIQAFNEQRTELYNEIIDEMETMD